MKSNVPEHFRHARLGMLDKKIFSPVLIYADQMRDQDSEDLRALQKGLFLCGPPGVGKSFAMAALTYFWATGNPKGDNVFITAPDLFEAYAAVRTEERSFDSYRGQYWTQTLETVPWLVINDLGKEYRGGKFDEQVPYQLGRLLRYRVEHRKVTHFTSNLTIVSKTGISVSTIYGESILSLLKESTDMFNTYGPDRRGIVPQRGVRP